MCTYLSTLSVLLLLLQIVLIQSSEWSKRMQMLSEPIVEDLAGLFECLVKLNGVEFSKEFRFGPD